MNIKSFYGEDLKIQILNIFTMYYYNGELAH